MYVYIQNAPNSWSVGYYDLTNTFHPESDHDERDSAIERVAHLNGCLYLMEISDRIDYLLHKFSYDKESD